MSSRLPLANLIFQLFLLPLSSHPNSWYLASSHWLAMPSTENAPPSTPGKSWIHQQMPAQVVFQHGSISQLPRPNTTTSGPLLSQHLVRTTLVNLTCIYRSVSPPKPRCDLHIQRPHCVCFWAHCAHHGALPPQREGFSLRVHAERRLPGSVDKWGNGSLLQQWTLCWVGEKVPHFRLFSLGQALEEEAQTDQWTASS